MKYDALFIIVSVALSSSLIGQTLRHSEHFVQTVSASNSVYIPIKAKRKDTVCRYVVTTEWLYKYIVGSDTANYESYVNHIKNIINRDSTLNIEIAESYYSLKVKDVPQIIRAKVKGKKYFIEKYFRSNGIIKRGVSLRYYPDIIFALFEWDIAVMFEHESGYIMIQK